MKKIQTSAYAPIAIGASADKATFAFCAKSYAIATVDKAINFSGPKFPAIAPVEMVHHYKTLVVRTTFAFLLLFSVSLLRPSPAVSSAVARIAIGATADALPASDKTPETSTKANISYREMAKAGDSLFHLKQYTQSFVLYGSLFQQKQYSPSMLLKMAYIQEGLGHLAQSMYYLNLYYLATNDPQALTKLEDAAAKNRLEGYEGSDAIRLVTFLKEHYNKVVMTLASFCFFLLALLSYQKIKKNQRPVIPAALLLFFLGLLLTHTYFSTHPAQGIISSPSTYLMEGPSAGSSVISIVGEGHRLEILGKKDVWLKVKWVEKEVYVKETEVLRLSL